MSTKYTTSQWLHHLDQRRDDATSWHSHQFETVRERKAFEAGHKQGAQDGRNLIHLHAGFELQDPRV